MPGARIDRGTAACQADTLPIKLLRRVVRVSVEVWVEEGDREEGAIHFLLLPCPAKNSEMFVLFV